MPTRSIGPFDVAPIGLGGMPLSLRTRPNERAGIEVIHAALDGGMTFIDTADVYCIDADDIGHNERLISKALAEWSGDRVVVATKGGLQRPGGAWTRNGHPEHLRAAADASLAALAVDCIDIYQLHAPDPDVPLADSVGELARLREQGKIAHVGLSNVSVDEIELASAIVPIVSVQNRCNPYDVRAWNTGVIAHCEANNIAFLPYSPVGGSRGKGRLGKDATLVAVAAELEATPYEVALAWLLARSPVIIPIPGASKVKNARSSASAMGLALTETQVATLDAAFLK
jgi:aryl-alcohol dehydrogenase-like predicted oxidoreductase